MANTITGTTNYATVTGHTVVDFSNPTESTKPSRPMAGWHPDDTWAPSRRVRAPTTLFGNGVAGHA